ncbi:MAG: GAF domain-containing protein [Ardenticatenaceae bacterium]|nr:GAF domain-containing protein [Ardenticatenaceae bacterium]
MTIESTDSISSFEPDFRFVQAFSDKADAVFWIADPESYQLVYVSKHVERALGLPAEDWLRPFFWQTYLFDADRTQVLATFAAAAASESIHHLEYRMVASDGNLVWFRDRVCLLTIDERPFLCGMMMNVTAFKTAVDHHIGMRGYTSIFLEIVTLLSGSAGIEQKLDQLANRLCDVFNLTAVSIFNWDPQWDVIAHFAHHATENYPHPEPDHQAGHHYTEVITGLSWWHQEAKPILALHNDPNLPAWQQAHLELHQAKTIFYLPILLQDEIIGVIELIDNNRVRTFTESDIELSKFVAQQVATAVARAQLFKAEANRRREAEILLDVAGFVSSSLDRDEILARVVEILRVYLSNVHNCSISLITEDGLQLETILSWYADKRFMMLPAGDRVFIQDTFTAQLAISGGEPIILSDLKKVPFTNEFTTKMMKEGLRAILCVPLSIKSRVMGTLHIHHWDEPRQFSSEEIALLQGVANQAAIAIENARLFANERRQLDLAKTLQKVGALLTTSLQLEEVYEHIFDLLDQVVSYDSASLFLFDEANDQFVLTVARGFDNSFINSREIILPAGRVYEQIALSPGWSVISDVQSLDSWVDLSNEQHHVRAWIGAYLFVKGQVNGILSLDGTLPGQFSAADGRMVSTFASQAAVAIENARLYNETMRQTKELAVLNEVSQETAVSLNIDRFLEKITRLVGADLFPHAFGFILYDAAQNELRAHESYLGMPKEVLQKTIPFPNSLIGHVLLTGEAHYAPNVLKDPFYFPGTQEVLSEVAVPLKVNEDVIGVIDVSSPEEEAFSQRDIHFLITLAGSMAAVLERARLYETLRIQAESLAEQVAHRTNELKLERDRLFAILESAGEGILLTDTEAHIMYANPAMERQSGYSRDELRLQDPRILGSSQAQQAVFDDMWKTLLSQERWSGELINQHKEGHVYDVAITVTPIANTAGEVTGYVSVQSDITRMKEIERLKTEFIANVSHQLRTPLTNIKTYVSLLSKGRPEKFPRYFSVLHHEIDRLARLIQDLLDISRLDAEVAPDQDAAADFCGFWEMFWPGFIERAERGNRRLQISLPPDVVEKSPLVFMETYQLEKILSRLVENSLLYSHEGSTVQVSVAQQNDQDNRLEIRVCDEGPGIPEAERPFIFDRFFRGAQAIESGAPGNGLGLAIVKELLTQYGGDISVESVSGQGSCFIVHLPLVQPEVSVAANDVH